MVAMPAQTSSIIVLNEPPVNGNFGTVQAPYSQEAEEALLGSILLQPTMYAVVAQFLHTEDFYILRHKYIWEAFERLAARDVQVDNLTLTEELKAFKRLDDVGGLAYLMHLTNDTPNSMNAETYGQLVSRMADRRRLMVAADRIKGLALDMELTNEQVSQESNAALIKAVGRAYVSQITSLSDSLGSYYDTIEARQKNPNQTTRAVPTGIRALDAHIQGLMRGQVNIVAAATGVGKSTFALNVALNASRLGARVAYFPLEMGKARTVNYVMGIEIGADPTRIELGQMTQAEWGRFVQASGNLYAPGHKLFIWDRPLNPDFQMTPAHLLTVCNALSVERGLDLVVVDYLGLMTSGKRELNGYADKAWVSRAMPIVADRLQVPMLVLAQIPIKKLQRRADKHPELGDMEFVGENDMDVCMYLHRDYIFDSGADPKQGEIIVGKARGRSFRGSIPVSFQNNKFVG